MKTNLSIRRSIMITILGAFLFLAGCASSSDTGQQLDPLAERGKEVFRQHCAACHANNGMTVIVGPSLAGIASRAGERLEGYSAVDYITESIMEPDAFLVEGYQNLMPTEFGLKLSGEQFDAIVAYLLTLD